MATSKRARNADREAAVEIINAAYVDGQLSETERDDRVSRALVARSTAQVEHSTTGLQRPQPTAAPTAAPKGGISGWWRSRSQAAKVGIVAAALMLPPAGLATTNLVEPDDTSEIGQTEAAPVTVDAETLSGLVSAYESSFSTTQTYGIVAMRDWTRVMVPTGDGPARYEEWTLVADGTFEQTDTRGAGDLQEFDLADLDLEALAVTLAEAESGLGVEDPNRTQVIVDHRTPAKRPQVVVNVSNKYVESAYLITNLAGKVTTREPYVTP